MFEIMKMCKVSIVIAAYNVDRYIGDTIKTVKEQTLKDIEIIVVDDASTDRTLEIIQVFAKEDNRIKIIHNEKNKGTSLARKIGVEMAVGEYVMFVDGDDLLKDDACERAYNAVKRENVDILQFGFDVVIGNTDSSRKDYDAFLNEVEEFKDAIKFTDKRIETDSRIGLLSCLKAPYDINVAMWNKIYSTELVKKISMDIPNEHLIYGEDWLFTYITLYYAKSYAYIHDKLYLYNFGVGISTDKILDKKRIAAVSKLLYIYKYMDKWLYENAIYEECKNSFKIIKEKLVNSVIYYFLVKCDEENRQYFADCLLRYVSINEFMSMVLYVNHHLDMVFPDVCARILSSLKQFQHSQKVISNIGIIGLKQEDVEKNTVFWIHVKELIRMGHSIVLLSDEKLEVEDKYLKYIAVHTNYSLTDTSTIEEWEQYISRLSYTFEYEQISLVLVFRKDKDNFLTDAITIKGNGRILIVYEFDNFVSVLKQMNVWRGGNPYLINRLADNVVVFTDTDLAWWSALGISSKKILNENTSNDINDIIYSVFDMKNSTNGYFAKELQSAISEFVMVYSEKIKEKDINLDTEINYYKKRVEHYKMMFNDSVEQNKTNNNRINYLENELQYYKKEYEYYLNEYNSYKKEYEYYKMMFDGLVEQNKSNNDRIKYLENEFEFYKKEYEYYLKEYEFYKKEYEYYLKEYEFYKKECEYYKIMFENSEKQNSINDGKNTGV